VASLGLHMLRVFFTGAYRNPREPNWLIGTLLAILAMLASYTGYSLPFDEFATTATGIGYNVAKSIPIAGDFISKLVFAGEFPTSATIPRLYFLHVMVVPAVIAVLLALHMGILIRQKHTEAEREESEARLAGVDRDDDSVIIGLPAVPNQAAVSLMVFFLTAATLAVLAGFLPAHNVAEYGPSNPATTPALVMPDWFLMWLYGFLKLIPAGLGFTVAGVHVSTEFLGGVFLPGILFLGIFAWPFLDRSEETHFTSHPMARPVPTAVGVAAIVLVMAASLAGMNNLVARILGTTTGVVTPLLAVLTVGGPVVAFGITYVLARGWTGGERRD
jgi:cytochrome b-561